MRTVRTLGLQLREVVTCQLRRACEIIRLKTKRIFLPGGPMRFKSYLILLVFAGVTVRAEVNVGHWSVALADDKTYVYASTVNDSGAVLGEYCYFGTKKCFWMLGTDSRCDKGSSYPILANSTAGAVPIKISCTGEVNPG